MSLTDKKRKITAQTIAFTAVFAALVCLATFVSVPLPFGYFNLGDIFVLLSSWCMGPVLGAVASGVGSALADILMGYVVYAPATLIIKAGIALAAYFSYVFLGKLLSKYELVPRAISALLGECVMVGGYFLYECFVLGYGVGAVASLPGNATQGVAAVVIATALIIPVRKQLGKILK